MRPKTKREQNLEANSSARPIPPGGAQMKEELDDLKAERERENARNRAAVADAQESKKANIRQRRLEGGSRFNIRYREGVPATALTPESVKAALEAYLEFPEAQAETDAAARQPFGATAPPPRRHRPADARACCKPTWTRCWACRASPPIGPRGSSR